MECPAPCFARRAASTLVLVFAATFLRAELPPLLPREAFLVNSLKHHYMISPDGSKLAFLDPDGVWIQTPGRNDARLVSKPQSTINAFYWAFDNRHLLFFAPSDEFENYHLCDFDIETGNQRDLTPYPGVRAKNLIMERSRQEDILIGLNKRDNRVFDMYRLNLRRGDIFLECQNPGDVAGWLADAELRVRAAVALNPKDGSTIMRVRDDITRPWRDLISWPFGETGFFEGDSGEIAQCFSADGKGIYVISAFGSNATKLARLSTSTGKIEELIAFDLKAGIEEVLFQPETRKVLAVRFNDLVPEWKTYNPDIQREFDFLRKKHAGVFQITSRDNDDRRWVICYVSDDNRESYFLYDRRQRDVSLLTEPLFHFEGQRFAAMKPVVIKARDGMDLPSYLTLPVGVPSRDLPLILLVHGGPWSRDSWGFDGEVQWLANRGYAVLQVNFRGSAGLGKDLFNAGMGKWGAEMQDDLTDAVRWAVKERIADPKRVGIMGGSYGGYATLAEVSFNPDVYACAVAGCGISDVRSFFKALPKLLEPVKTVLARRVGKAIEDDQLNRRISPYYHTDRIRAKLMIYHGENDPRVRIFESDQMVRRIRETHGEVRYVVYEDEGHGISQGCNLLDLWGRIEEFLAESLGGRFMPWTPVPGCTAHNK